MNFSKSYIYHTSVSFQKTVQASKIEQPQRQLAGKEPPQIAGDPKAGNGKENKAQPQQQADNVHGKNISGQPKPLQNAGKRGVQIKEWAQ